MRKIPCRPRPEAEALEDRWLPSVMSFTAPTGNGDDALVLRLSSDSNKLELYHNGDLADQQELSGLEEVQITGAAGEVDTLTLDYGLGFFSVPVTFNGGFGGGDRVAVSAAVNFTLSASALTTSQGSPVSLAGVEEAVLTGGDDGTVFNASGFGGAATLTGGAGDDTYHLDPGGTITVFDGGGNDTVNLQAISGTGVTASLGADSGTVAKISNPSARVEIQARIETLIGTGQADRLTATNVTDEALTQTLVGGAGNDILTDGTTAEFLVLAGGAMSGVAVPGGGNDTYHLDPGSTITVIDDGGDDTVNLSGVTAGGATVNLATPTGTVVVQGGLVNVITGIIENLIGTNFADLIAGNALNNLLEGGLGNDTLVGGGGSDSLVGGDGIDSIAGGPGDDTLAGGLGDDTLVAGDGSDSLAGGPGSDSLNGGSGADRFLVAPGSTETIVDTSGIETVSFADASRGISLNMAASGPQIVDTAGNRVQFVGVFENVIGTRFADDINGNNADNLIVGGGGDDRLSGHSGRDVLVGGAGSDRLVGGPDDDILIGGRTSFDADEVALLAIQAEWSSSRNLAARVANLRGTGTGDRLNGNVFLKVSGAGQTVFDDEAQDKLTGSSGQDWFFILASDGATDQKNDEPVN